MKKRALALFLSLVLCISLLPAALAAGKTYEEAVREFREEDPMREISQTFDSDYGTVFIYGAPNPHGATGSLRFITKAPCAKGEGETIGLPTPRHGIMCTTRPPLTAVLSEDGRTFTYTYHYDEPLTVVQGPMLRPAGDFIYTLDLTTGEVTEDVPTIPADYNTYAAALERVKSEEGWVIEQTLDAPACTVLLRYFQAGDGRRSYFLVLVWKIDNALVSAGGVASYNLTITRDDGTGEAGFPVYYTHRAPDTLTLNEDKTLLTYTYSESLAGGPDSETLELATGLSSKFNTLPTIEPQETQQPPAAEFTDVPAGSWFEKGVSTCAQKGVMIGTSSTTFSPETALSRAQCLTLALRLYDLQRGRTGALEKAPEDWGTVVVSLADGTVIRGHQAEDIFFNVSRLDPSGGKVLTFGREPSLLGQGWAADGSQKATVTLNGIVITGTVRQEGYADDGVRRVVNFLPDNPDDSTLIEEFFRQTHPKEGLWYRDTIYTAKSWGLIDWEKYPGIAGLTESLLNSTDEDAARYEFAAALAEAAGELPQLYSSVSLPDVREDTLYYEKILSLYKSGILNGVDPSGSFDYYGTLTRAQAAVMVARVLDESQRVTTPPQEGGAYAQAVAELRNKMGYSNEQTFETDLCTVFVYDLGGFMNAPTGAIQIIYKAGSPLGEGYVLDLPHVRSGWSITPADTMELSADQKTFTYTYFYDTTAYDSSIQSYDTRVEPGTFTFTVDLPTGEIHREYRPMDYAGALAHVTRKRIHSSGEHSESREVIQVLETDQCTVVLTKGRFVDKYDDYILSLVYKPGSALGDGTIQRLLLPSTVYDKGYPWYNPTDRAPDPLILSEDGKALTYTYHFDDALEDFHEAGTYTYTVDLATGELSVTHTPN